MLANGDGEADTGRRARWRSTAMGERGIEPLGAGGRPDRLGDERLGRRGSAKAVACACVVEGGGAKGERGERRSGALGSGSSASIQTGEEGDGVREGEWEGLWGVGLGSSVSGEWEGGYAGRGGPAGVG